MRKFTLAEKQEYAKSRGYELLNKENFTSKETAILRGPDGYDYLVNWAEFYQRGSKPKRTTLETKRRQCKERGYTLLADKNPKIDSKVKLLNDETGYVYEVRLSDFLYKGSREKVGKTMSKGEAYIYGFLDANLNKGYTFTYQDKVSYGNGKMGWFDFSIQDDEGNTLAFIEFNGIQHYEVSPLYGEEHFKLTQESDRLKQEYADANNIPLLWIPYTDTEIDKTIKKALPKIIRDNLKPFKPSATHHNFHTTLEEKKEFARSKGYELLETENFAVTKKVKLRESSGSIWETRWHDFLYGNSKQSREASNESLRKTTLEEKKAIAKCVGLTLLETENFSNKTKVSLMDREGNTIIRTWGAIEARYEKIITKG